MTQAYTNFFNDAMKEAMNPENFLKYSNSFDVAKVTDSLKKGAETLNEASNVAIESAQSIFKRSNEIVQDNAKNAFNALKEVASASTPEQAIAKQQKFAECFVNESVSNAKEMFDMFSKSTMEFYNRVRQASENMACAVPVSCGASSKSKK